MIGRQEMVYVPGGTTTVMTGQSTMMTPAPVLVTGSSYVGAHGSVIVGQPVIQQPTVIVRPVYPTTYLGGLRTGFWRTSALGTKYVLGPALIVFGSIKILIGVLIFSLNFDFDDVNTAGIIIGLICFAIGIGLVIGGARLIQKSKEKLKELNNQSGIDDPGYVYPSRNQQGNQPQQNQHSPYPNEQNPQTSYPPQYQMDPTQPGTIGFGGMPPQDSYPTKNPNSTNENDMPPPYPGASSSVPPYNPAYNPDYPTKS